MPWHDSGLVPGEGGRAQIWEEGTEEKEGNLAAIPKRGADWLSDRFASPVKLGMCPAI